MQEDYLHYLWRYGLYTTDKLTTRDGQPVSVVKPGQYNTNAGPDFLMARIRIGEAIWAGHVEIHVKASDWFRHQHSRDPAYHSVILHVVYEDDATVLDPTGKPIPTVRLPVNEKFLRNYHQILNALDPLACARKLTNIPELILIQHFERMGVERMEQRTARMKHRLTLCKGSYEEVLFQLLFRQFGFGVNQEAFDHLATQIPFKTIRLLRHNLFALESLLFGMSGLMPENPAKDPYLKAMQAEFFFLRRKHNIDPIPINEWKFLRMRPVNFPTVRMAQLAAFIHQHPDLLERVIKSHGMMAPDDFHCQLSTYWKHHYDFEKPGSMTDGILGQETVLLLRINLLLPFASFWLIEHQQAENHLKWLILLQALPPENNKILRLWQSAGVKADNAFVSQAAIYLYNHYCRERKCLSCAIGQYLIKNG